jgi:MerR family transcriptional regulator/heat shock protein HspR
VDERTAVFIISVASRLVDMHPSTLRKYEGCGLLEPCRQSGRLRLYSLEDIARLHQIKTLVEQDGINLAGVKLALQLTEKALRLRRQVETSGDSIPAGEVKDLANEMLALLGAVVPRSHSGKATQSDQTSS